MTTCQKKNNSSQKKKKTTQKYEYERIINSIPQTLETLAGAIEYTDYFYAEG